MNTPMQFGERVEGYNISVLNEREIRASAGILFIVMFSSIAFIELKGNYILLKYFITLFLIDFIIRVFVHPRYAPTLIIGRLIVRGQNPEYVGAAQKKFAWMIGLFLAAIMFLLMVVINSYSIVSSIICGMCVIFLFFESAFGICLGCLFYRWFYKEKAQYCPGEICEAKTKQDIQKITPAQIGIAIGFVVIILLIVYFFKDQFSANSNNLWEMIGTKK
jgi:hypothetical protein